MKRNYIINDARINACLRRFDDNVYTGLEFLKAASDMKQGSCDLYTDSDSDSADDDQATVVKVVMCSRGGGSASEVESHKNIDSVLHTKTTFQAHSIFSVSIQK